MLVPICDVVCSFPCKYDKYEGHLFAHLIYVLNMFLKIQVLKWYIIVELRS